MSADWKKRALVAEAKLAGYRRLRDEASAVHSAFIEWKSNIGVRGRTLPLDRLIEPKLDELEEELAHLDVVDPPFDFFAQRTTKLDRNLTVERARGLGTCSKFDLGTMKVLLDAEQPDAAKLVGLIFQLVQLADMASIQAGSDEKAVTQRWLQERAPALAMLLIATRLLNPEVPVEASDIQALAG